MRGPCLGDIEPLQYLVWKQLWKLRILVELRHALFGHRPDYKNSVLGYNSCKNTALGLENSVRDMYHARINWPGWWVWERSGMEGRLKGEEMQLPLGRTVTSPCGCLVSRKYS